MNPTAKRECGAGQLRLQSEYACYEVLCGGNDIYIMGLGFLKNPPQLVLGYLNWQYRFF
jgi:hypothetical protein